MKVDKKCNSIVHLVITMIGVVAGDSGWLQCGVYFSFFCFRVNKQCPLRREAEKEQGWKGLERIHLSEKNRVLNCHTVKWINVWRGVYRGLRSGVGVGVTREGVGVDYRKYSWSKGTNCSKIYVQWVGGWFFTPKTVGTRQHCYVPTLGTLTPPPFPGGYSTYILTSGGSADI